VSKVFFIQDNGNTDRHIPIKVEEVTGFAPFEDRCEIYLTCNRKFVSRNKYSETTKEVVGGKTKFFEPVRDLFIKASEPH